MSQESFHVGGRPTEHAQAGEAGEAGEAEPPELLDELLGGPGGPVPVPVPVAGVRLPPIPGPIPGPIRRPVRSGGS